MKKVFHTILFILILIVVLKWLSFNDYYRTNFIELSKDEKDLFEWKDEYDEYLDHRNAFSEHFGKSEFKFPRQEVYKIKMFEKDKFFKRFWVSKTLKQEKIKELIEFFNNSKNYDWGETTWGDKDIDFIFKFYDNENRLVGKIDICYQDCGWLKTKPFTPNMKYGQLSHLGYKELFLIIYKLNYWE